MKADKVLVILGFILAVVLLVDWLSYGNRNGEIPPSLRSIVLDLNSGDIHIRESAQYALHNLGTNAVPKLLRMYGGPESSKRSLFSNSRPRLSENKIQVFAAFSELGSNAAPAVPILLQDLQTIHSPYGGRIADALGAIGEPALEPTVSVLKTNYNWMVRSSCLYALSRMGATAEKAIPTLTNLLAHSDDRLRSDIISTLGAIGREPEIVIPILAHELTASNKNSRSEAAQAIANFGTNAAIAINELHDAAKDPSPRVKVAISSALNIPKLLPTRLCGRARLQFLCSKRPFKKILTTTLQQLISKRTCNKFAIYRNEFLPTRGTMPFAYAVLIWRESLALPVSRAGCLWRGMAHNSRTVCPL